MKRRILLFGGLAVLLLALPVLSVSLSYRAFTGNETFVELPRGTGTRAMAEQLAQAGVIRYPWQFLVLRILNPSAKLQAGEYKFAQPASALDVFHRIERGDIYYFDFTVPEGDNMFDIAHLLDSSGILSGEDFLRAAADPMPIHDLDPSAKNLEGYLFPSTYRLSHATTAADLCLMMTAEFRRQWKKLGDNAGPPRQTVTMASLVEKESGIADERPLIAGVFTNRLKQGIRLDCDPTVIYAALLDNRYKGVIHRSDLSSHNAYNTYQNDGLPPGPIANPGAGSLAAALHPADTKFLYFVAKGIGGGHQFSATLNEHEKAVQAYRRATRKKS